MVFSLIAVVPAAGESVRMRPLTLSRPKHLLPVAGKPIIQWLVETIKNLGIVDIILIVGYHKEVICNFLQDGSQFGVNISYIEQEKPLGLGHAIGLAEPYIDCTFIAMCGDNLYRADLSRIVKKHIDRKDVVTLLVEEVPDPWRYGVVKAATDGRILELVEKPEQPPSNKVITGFYVFEPEIFNAIKHTSPSKRGEIEITDAIDRLAAEGSQVYGEPLLGWRKDVGYPWDLLEANEVYLKDLTRRDAHPKVSGPARIGSETTIRDGARITGPLIIGEHCKIGFSELRPYTSMGNNVEISDGVIVENSIIMDGVLLEEGTEIKHSIIGENSRIGKSVRTETTHPTQDFIRFMVQGRIVNSHRKHVGAIIADGVKINSNRILKPGEIIPAINNIRAII
jgi:UDP-N-acetylglucosamine diphosphorylase/glucosamine-1-phosphate N-acetyltransferase